MERYDLPISLFVENFSCFLKTSVQKEKKGYNNPLFAK